MALTADTSAFPALGGEYIKMAGVRVAPAQVFLHRAGDHHIVGVIEAGQDERAQQSGVHLNRIGPGGIPRTPKQCQAWATGAHPKGVGKIAN
jgi:hypothetical protein